MRKDYYKLLIYWPDPIHVIDCKTNEKRVGLAADVLTWSAIVQGFTASDGGGEEARGHAHVVDC